jgi:hypothetical protein
MAMRIHTGVPGAGKTYLLVKSYVDMFCRWDKETARYVKKPEHEDKILISNIEGLTLEHLDLETLMTDRCMTMARQKWADNPKVKDLTEMDDVIQSYFYEFLSEKVRHFFAYDHQVQIAKDHGPVIYLIEESQRYFDAKELGRSAWVRDILYFFEKHRHMGFSVLMDTQHISKIHKGIAVLFESEIQAKPRTMSVAGEMRYNEIADGVKVNQMPIVHRPKKEIFATYKSMAAKESIKPKKPMLKLACFILFCLVACFFAFGWAKKSIGPDDVAAAELETQKELPPGGQRAMETAPQPGSWVRLSHIMKSNGRVFVIHPVYKAPVPVESLGLKLKVVGTVFYAYVVGQNTYESPGSPGDP